MKQIESEIKDIFRDIFENINEGIYLHDLDGNFIDINTHFINNIGYSKNEMKTKNVRDLIPEQYKSKFDDYLKRIKVNGYEKGLFKVVTKHGSTHAVEYSNSLVTGKDLGSILRLADFGQHPLAAHFGSDEVGVLAPEIDHGYGIVLHEWIPGIWQGQTVCPLSSKEPGNTQVRSLAIGQQK